jgi:hypothetical protein
LAPFRAERQMARELVAPGDLGSTEADRVENNRRVAEMAKLFLEAGLITMVAFISCSRGNTSCSGPSRTDALIVY